MIDIVYRCECGMSYTKGAFTKIKNRNIKRCIKCGKNFTLQHNVKDKEYIKCWCCNNENVVIGKKCSNCGKIV